MSIAAPASMEASAARPARRKSAGLRRVREGGIVGGLLLCGGLSLATTIAIVITLGVDTIKFLQFPDVTLSGFLLGREWAALQGGPYGVLPLVTGTAMVALISTLVSGPLGLITAIWLSEYAPLRLRNLLKPILEILAGIPTVVLGFFALTALTPALQAILPFEIGTYNILAAGIAVGILTLPIVTSLSEDALRAVPRGLREGSYGLGATRFETALRVVTPAALSGIVAAMLLAVARAVGETMVVALAAGSRPVPLKDSLANALDVTQGMQPMTGYLVQVTGGDVSNFGVEYYSLYAVAAVLFVMTFILTLIGQMIRARFQQQYE